MASSRRFLIIFTTLAVTFSFSGAVRSDVDGDGTDEIGVFGIEVQGPARGPMYQIVDQNGQLLATRFVLPDFHDHKFKMIDTDGDGTDELVVLAVRSSDGLATVQVRTPQGVLLASGWVTTSLFNNHELLEIRPGGTAASDIGIGYSNFGGTQAFYQVWRRSGSSLNRIRTGALTSSGFGAVSWDAADFDGNGDDEVLLGFRRQADGAAGFQIWDPGTNSSMAFRTVSGSPFVEHQFVAGDFHLASPGMEVLVGFNRKSDGAGFYQVFNESATQLASRRVSLAEFDNFVWDRVGNGSRDLVFVGFTRVSNEMIEYQVWDPLSGSMTGSAAVVGLNFQALQWLTGNFDGNAANGDEIVVGIRRIDGTSSGAISYQQWDRVGNNQGTTWSALPSGYVSPHFLKVAAVTPNQDNLVIGARLTGGSPAIQLWDTNGPGRGSLLLFRFVLNANVS